VGRGAAVVLRAGVVGRALEVAEAAGEGGGERQMEETKHRRAAFAMPMPRRGSGGCGGKWRRIKCFQKWWGFCAPADGGGAGPRQVGTMVPGCCRSKAISARGRSSR